MGLSKHAKELHLLGEKGLARQIEMRIKEKLQRAPKTDSKLRHHLRLQALQREDQRLEEQEAARQEDLERARAKTDQKLADTQLKLARVRERDHGHDVKIAQLEQTPKRLQREAAVREQEAVCKKVFNDAAANLARKLCGCQPARRAELKEAMRRRVEKAQADGSWPSKGVPDL